MHDIRSTYLLVISASMTALTVCSNTGDRHSQSLWTTSIFWL